MTIEAAAASTWLLKDIRDELRLLRQLFENQLEVVRDVAEALWPSSKTSGKQGLNSETKKALRESFIYDTGLDTLIQRVRQMDKEASMTLEGVSISISTLVSPLIFVS